MSKTGVFSDSQEKNCFVAYDFESERKKADEETAVSGASLEQSSTGVVYGKSTPLSDHCCHLRQAVVLSRTDVKAAGNTDLPGFELRQLPDQILLGSERFV